MSKDLLNITPALEYKAPKIPTLKDTRANPAILKKLPSRWRKNAAVITCLGILGSSVFSGCAQSPGDVAYVDSGNGGEDYSGGYNGADDGQAEDSGSGYNGGDSGQAGYHSSYNGYSEFDLTLRVHHGGSGSAVYVVHLTEQEALGIIRAQLEAVGFSFGDTLPAYTALEEWWGPSIGIDLYDSGRGIAVSHLNWESSNRGFSPTGRNFANMVAEDFAERTDIPVGVFYTPSVMPGWDEETRQIRPEWDAMPHWYETDDGRWVSEELIPPTDQMIAQAKVEARPILEGRVTAQVQEFIDFLRAESII